MKFIITFILLTFVSYSFAQDNGVIGAGLNNLTSDSAYTSGSWVTNYQDTSIKGSVYLFEDWSTKGIITTQSDRNLVIEGLNYDTLNDNFVVKVSTDSVFIFNNTDIKEININNHKFKAYSTSNTSTKSYFEIIAVGHDVEFLKQYEKKIKKGKLDPLTQLLEQDKYVETYTYFFKSGNELKEIKLNKKSFSKLFGEHKDKIKAFIESEHLAIKEEKNIQVVVNYYNTL